VRVDVERTMDNGKWSMENQCGEARLPPFSVIHYPFFIARAYHPPTRSGLRMIRPLTDEHSHKEKKPEQDHQEKRDQHREQAAEVGIAFLVPGVRLGAVRARSVFRYKWLAALRTQLEEHRSRIDPDRWKGEGGERAERGERVSG
jgi:hypothetical protein